MPRRCGPALLHTGQTEQLGFSLGQDELPGVLRICRAVGGFRLALELASVAFYAYPAELPDSDDMSYLGAFFYGSDELPVEVVQLYVATDARVEGSCTFRGSFEDPDTGEEIDYTDIVSYDLSLSAGWNDVIFTYGSRADDTFTLDITTGAPPEGLTWRYLARPPEEPPLPCEDPSAPGCEPIGALGAAEARVARLRASTPTFLHPTSRELR